MVFRRLFFFRQRYFVGFEKKFRRNTIFVGNLSDEKPVQIFDSWQISDEKPVKISDSPKISDEKPGQSFQWSEISDEKPAEIF